jgi:prepilin-type processing-associated H-X9-DG protein
MCPSEKVGFGSYNDDLYYYTHYGINSWVSSGYNDDYPRRKLSEMREPSTAKCILDNKKQNTSHTAYGVYVHFRHGGYRANCLYVDGHAVSATRGDLFGPWGTGSNAMKWGAIWFP